MTFQYIRHSPTNGGGGGGPSTPNTTTLDAVALWGDTHGGSLLNSPLISTGGNLAVPNGLSVGGGTLAFGILPGTVIASDNSSGKQLYAYIGASEAAQGAGQPDGQIGFFDYPSGEGPIWGMFHNTNTMGLYNTGDAAGPLGGYYSALDFVMPGNGSPPYGGVTMLWGTDGVGDIGAASDHRPNHIYAKTSISTPLLTLTGFTQGSVLFAGASGAVSQDNGQLFWDDTNKILCVGTKTPLTEWIPSNHHGTIVIDAPGDGTVEDFPILALSIDTSGVSPNTDGAIYWINNNPSDVGELGVISTFRYDGTNSFSGSGVTNGFVFAARKTALDPNPATDILRINQIASNVLMVDAIAASAGVVEFRYANHMCLTYGYDPTTGVLIQTDGSLIKDDGNNLGTFGGLENFYQSAYKWGFFGTGGVRIGTSDATWNAPTFLLEIAGVGRDSYVKHYNTASAVGMLVGIDASGNGEVLHRDAFPLSLGVNNTAAYQITTGNTLKNLLGANEATGAGVPLAGANCPAADPTTPYTWIKMISSDGSTVYVAAYK